MSKLDAFPETRGLAQAWVDSLDSETKAQYLACCKTEDNLLRLWARVCTDVWGMPLDVPPPTLKRARMYDWDRL